MGVRIYIYVGVCTTPNGIGKITASFTRKNVDAWIDKQWTSMIKTHDLDYDSGHCRNGRYGGKGGYSEYGPFMLKIYKVRII